MGELKLAKFVAGRKIQPCIWGKTEKESLEITHSHAH